MVELIKAISDFTSSQSVWAYMFIFVGKIAEVTLATTRIVLIGRGERVIGSCVALFEFTLWIIITSSVLSNFSSDPLKVVVLIIAFAVGNFTGSYLEELLALGLCSVQTVIKDEQTVGELATFLRSKGFGVTTMDARGMEEGPRYLLLMTLKRKRVKEAVALIRQRCENAVITVSDVKSQKGGYLGKPNVARRTMFK